MTPHWMHGLERFYRQTGRTTRRLWGAICYVRAGYAVVFLGPTVPVVRAAQALCGRLDREAGRRISFRVDDAFALRGVGASAVIIRDHTLDPPVRLPVVDEA